MRALVIEDEPAIRRRLIEHLRSLNFAVDSAEDGTEGSYLARTNSYDIVILDYMLPEKQGPMVCEEIRRVGKHMPIIMLSVLADTWRKVELLDAGADDYLTKPFSAEELTARIRAVMRRPAKIEGDTLMLDDLSLDTRQQIVRRGARGISLTRKEYMLLEYLMRNIGSVLTRGMIMEHVWDMTSDPFSNTIESHIMSLRRKLEADGEPRLIHTVPARGYKIASIPE